MKNKICIISILLIFLFTINSYANNVNDYLLKGDMRYQNEFDYTLVQLYPNINDITASIESNKKFVYLHEDCYEGNAIPVNVGTLESPNFIIFMQIDDNNIAVQRIKAVYLDLDGDKYYEAYCTDENGKILRNVRLNDKYYLNDIGQTISDGVPVQHYLYSGPYWDWLKSVFK